MKSKFVSNRSVKLHYLVREGSKPAIVLLHGAGSNNTVWKRIMPHLKGRKLIIPDFRGHGSSARGAISINNSISDLKVILEKERERSVDLVGYSLGATTAYAFSQQYPKNINRLALLSNVSINITRLSRLVKTLNLGLLNIIMLFNSNRKLVLQDYSKSKNILSSFLSDIKGTSMNAYLGAVEMVLANEMDFSKIRHKTLLLQGKYDYSLKKSKLAESLGKNTQLRYMPTHHLLVNKPEELGPILRNFLTS